MAEDEFNLDDPGSGGGSEDSLDDFFQPAGGKSDKPAGGGQTVDDIFAPPSEAPKTKPAKPAKPSASELPILKSNFGQFADEPESMNTPLTEPAAPAPEPAPNEAAAAEKKSFMARALIPLALVLVLILALGAAYMAYTKFFAPTKEIAAVTPLPKPKPKPKPKPQVAPQPETGTGAAPGAATTTPGATVEKRGGASATAKPAAGGTGIETEEETPARPAPPSGKPGKPVKPVTAAVETEPPAPAEAAPKPAKPGGPGKPAPAAAVPPKPEPRPAPATAKPGALPVPPKPVAQTPRPAPATAKPGARPVPPKPVAQAPRPAPVPAGGPWYVQVGSYMLESSKDQPEQKLRELGFAQFHYTPESRRLRIHHVLVGKNLSPDQARQITSELQSLGYAAAPGPGGSVRAYTYGNISIARATRAKLVKAGIKQVTIKSETKTVSLDQLRVGGYATRAQAAKALSELSRGGFRGALIVKE